MSKRTELIKDFLTAFSKVDRNDFVEALLAPNFTFSAPPDPLLDRNEFFEKCWPHGGELNDIDYVRVIEAGDEVIVTHEFIKMNGSKERNTDVFTFEEDRIVRLEVYFGWTVSSSS